MKTYLLTKVALIFMFILRAQSLPTEVFNEIISITNCVPIDSDTLSSTPDYFLMYLTSYNTDGRLAYIMKSDGSDNNKESAYKLKFDHLEIGLIQYKRFSTQITGVNDRRPITRYVHNTCEYNLYMIPFMYDTVHKEIIHLKDTYNANFKNNELTFEIMFFSKNKESFPYAIFLTFIEDTNTNPKKLQFKKFKIINMDGYKFYDMANDNNSYPFYANSIKQAITYGLPKIDYLEKNNIKTNPLIINNSDPKNDNNRNYYKLVSILLGVLLGVFIFVVILLIYLLKRKGIRGSVRNRMKKS